MFEIRYESMDDDEYFEHRGLTERTDGCWNYRHCYRLSSIAFQPLAVASAYLLNNIGSISFYSALAVPALFSFGVDFCINAYACVDQISCGITSKKLVLTELPYAAAAITYLISANPNTAIVAGSTTAFVTNVIKAASSIRKCCSTLFNQPRRNVGEMQSCDQQTPAPAPCP